MDMLNKIVKQEYQSKLADWQRFSKPRELEGLAIIGEIYDCKGSKKVTRLLPEEKILYETRQSLLSQNFDRSFQEADQFWRRKQLTTSYQFYHGASLHKSTHPNIFAFKTLQQLDLSRPLTPMTVSFIDNWLGLNDRREYQDLVLACLRSIRSKVEVSDLKHSEMRSKYHGRQDWSLSQPIRMDRIGEELFQFKPNVSAIKKQEEKMVKLKDRLEQHEKSDFAKQLSIYKHFKIN